MSLDVKGAEISEHFACAFIFKLEKYFFPKVGDFSWIQGLNFG